MTKRVIYAALLISAIVLIDQATKYLARTHIDPFETVRIMPLLNLVNVRNTGAAFGMFKEFGNIFFITISVCAIIFMLWVIIAGKEDYRIFSLLTGGAAGNLIDRIRLGYVVDFIDVTVSGFHWPAFNVADSALTVGILLMMLKLIIKRD